LLPYIEEALKMEKGRKVSKFFLVWFKSLQSKGHPDSGERLLRCAAHYDEKVVKSEICRRHPNCRLLSRARRGSREKPEARYLRAHYHGGLRQRGRVIKELTRQTGFPRWFIKRQARRLGLTMHPDRRPWTPQELDALDRLLGKVSAGTIAKRLKRSETSVVMKTKAIGHSRRITEGYTIRDLELCLGEDHRKIQKWLAAGWLRNGIQGGQQHNGNGHDIHRFHENEIINFIKRHPAEINLGKVDAIWFLDLVLMKGSEASTPRG
jgi:hypothetical protein